MSVRYARPDVSDLMLHVLRRSVHPELFTIHAERRIVQDDFSAMVRICDTGHWVSFQANGETITELTATREHLLPQRKRFLEKRLRGSREEFLQFDPGFSYQVCYQLEQLAPDVFLSVHEELILDCPKATVAHEFPPSSRFGPNALSVVRTEAWSRGLLVYAYHTFPQSCSIVKTQSLFEMS